LSRRVGQAGSVFQRGFATSWDPTAPAYGRFWVDTPGCDNRKRRVVSLGVCHSRSTARRKLRELIELEGINTREYFRANTAPATTFRGQAATWLASLATRRRKPVKQSTIHGWRQALNKWVLPNLGDRLLADVGNAALKELTEKMLDAGLSTQSIVNYTKVAKMVVASAVNSEGDQLYPRKWNHDFIGIPILRREEQLRQTITEAELTDVLANTTPRYSILFALLAGSGLRIGEALALKTQNLSPDCRVIRVRATLWNGQEQPPKTPNAVREVDVPELLAAHLRAHVANKSGYLFPTASGKPLGQRNALRALHSTGRKIGLHSFRRFRTETLRRARVPEDLIKLWLGHSKESVTDFYAGGLQNDLAWRQDWCEQVGLGFGLRWATNVKPLVRAKAA
jgi:integrase